MTKYASEQEVMSMTNEEIAERLGYVKTRGINIQAQKYDVAVIEKHLQDGWFNSNSDLFFTDINDLLRFHEKDDEEDT